MAPRTQADRAHILGVAIDRLDMAETVARGRAAIERGEYVQQMSINALKIVTLHDDPDLRGLLEGCAIVNADGQSVVWASQLLGDALPTRVAGIDLMHEMLALAAQQGWGVFVLGAKADVLAQGIARLEELHPGLRIAGSRDGYFAEGDEGAVCDEIRAASPEILLVAMPSPRKEYFLAEHGPDLGVPYVMGVGGAIDVAAGVAKRAPRSWQVLGIEWLYRLLQEPSRLTGRYLRTNARFLGLLAVAIARRLVR